MPKIAGKHCLLRPLTASDAAVSLAWRQDPHTRDRVMGYRLPVTEIGEAAWYEDVARDRSGRQAFFAIDDLDGTFVGIVRLVNIDWVCQSATFGIVIGDTEKRARGIGREATWLILKYGFDTLNLRRVGLSVLPSNEAAIRLYRSIGFVDEGRLREAYFSNGSFHDVLLMGLLHHELVASPAKAYSTTA